MVFLAEINNNITNIRKQVYLTKFLGIIFRFGLWPTTVSVAEADFSEEPSGVPILWVDVLGTGSTATGVTALTFCDLKLKTNSK